MFFQKKFWRSLKTRFFNRRTFAEEVVFQLSLPSCVLNKQGVVLFSNAEAQKIMGNLGSFWNFSHFLEEDDEKKFKFFLEKCHFSPPSGNLPHSSASLFFSRCKETFKSSKQDQMFQIFCAPLPSEPSLCLVTFCPFEKIHSPRNWIGDVSDSLVTEIFEQEQTPTLFVDSQGRIRAYNMSFKDFIPFSLSIGEAFKEFISEETWGELEPLLASLPLHKDLKKNLTFKFKEAETENTGILRPFGTQGALIFFLKASEQKNLQLQVIQSQKLHAMGELAGGIAHDFNNLLTAMIGFCDLLLMRHSPNDQSFTDIMQIKQNANRAANLVRQLLAFSRKQSLQPRKIDVTDNLAELRILLQRLIGPSVDLNIIHGRNLGFIKVDQGQLEQVIINLVVNARDAMPNGGSISISTQATEVKGLLHHASGVIPKGMYVVISIEDTGIGISPENLPRIFDPFFTTKEIGMGTGLGLSTVYGIVAQMEGYILVDTEVGKGSAFRIYLPQYQLGKNEMPYCASHDSQIKDLTGDASILLVEDEVAVRKFAVRTLKEKGYRVTEAQNGKEAYEYILSALSRKEPIDLLITDVVMPEMEGPELVEKAQKVLPDLKIIFMSGYAESTFRHRLSNEQDIHFLSKPFNLKDLALKVKEITQEKGRNKERKTKGNVISNYGGGPPYSPARLSKL